MANEYQISAGIPPKDNSSGATSNNFYISAGLIPDDTAEVGEANPFWYYQMLRRRNT